MVANVSAADVAELATASQKAASTANSVGVNMDQLNAQIATIESVTRDAPEQIGNGLKTLYARFSDIKLGKTLEDGVNLGQVTGQLNKLGVQVLDQFGNTESKIGTGNNFSSKKKEQIHFDKRDFIRMKEDNIFDEYELKDKLGEGAYGCVYKVQQKTTNFLRAVKAIKKKNVDYNEFNNEIEVLKAIDHPNIIKLFDCYQEILLYG